MEKKLILHKQNRVSGQTLTTAAAAAAGLARLIHHSQEHQELKSLEAVAANQSGQTVDLIRRVTAPATRATIIIYPTSKCPFWCYIKIQTLKYLCFSEIENNKVTVVTFTVDYICKTAVLLVIKGLILQYQLLSSRFKQLHVWPLGLKCLPLKSAYLPLRLERYSHSQCRPK